jgi:hypothetical protein
LGKFCVTDKVFFTSKTNLNMKLFIKVGELTKNVQHDEILGQSFEASAELVKAEPNLPAR